LLAQLKGERANACKKKAIIDLLGRYQVKRELIQKFIDENAIQRRDNIDDEFENSGKVLALGKLCDDEHLDKLQFKALIDAYIYSGREPIKDEVFNV
jgi:type I restriction enzyme R subunit